MIFRDKENHVVTSDKLRRASLTIDRPILLDAEIRLHPVLHLWHNNGPIRQQYNKEHILDWTFNRVRKANELERHRQRPEFLSLQRADLRVVEGRHKIGGDLGHFLFRYGIGRILFTGFKDVFQSASVLGSASVSK